MTPFSLAERFVPGRERAIVFDGASHPEKGHYAEKLGEETTLYRAFPALPMRQQSFLAEEDFTDRVESRPFAFSMRSSPNSMRILRSRDGDVKINSLVCYSLDSSWHVNANRDAVWFVYSGCGGLTTSFGHLPVRLHDFVFIPRDVAYRIEAMEDRPLRLVGIESRESLRKPYFVPCAGSSSPYSDADLGLPVPQGIYEAGDKWNVYINYGNSVTLATYRHSLAHCFAWRGTLYPFVLHAKDVHPRSDHAQHADPTNYAIFATASGSVTVSAFLPRHPHSLPCCRTNDHDEFLFYTKPYATRSGVVGEGDATFHPKGSRDSHPKASEDCEGPGWVDECAVMFESREPLFLTSAAKKIEIPSGPIFGAIEAVRAVQNPRR